VRSSLVVALAIALGGCSTPRRSGPFDAADGGSSAPGAASVAASATAEPRPVEPIELEIGFAAPPPLPSTEANRALRDGLAKHARKDYAASLVAFARALELAPDDPFARFDLACAAARTGDVARSAREMSALLALDLVAYRSKLERDPDLADLRASGEMPRLEAHAAALAEAYERAAAEGAAAVVYRLRTPQNDASVQDPSWFRAGVWVQRTRRFVPLSPDIAHGVAWYDRARKKTFFIDAPAVDCGNDFCPDLGDASLRVYPLLSAMPEQSAAVPRGDDLLFAITLHVGLDRDLAPAPIVAELAVMGGARFLRADGGRLVKATARDLEGPGTTVLFTANGALYGAAPEGFRVERGQLVTPAGKVKLDPRHGEGQHTIIARGGRALVVTSVARCECVQKEGDVIRHAVSLVDTGASTSSLLDAGPATAAATTDAAGAIYLQVGEAVRRFDDLDAIGPAPAGDALPAGVRLGLLPRAIEVCCGL
jgi:hypothetical protein